MAPTAAMLILRRHTRPMPQASSAAQASTSAPSFLVKFSFAKWVSHCSSIFQTRSEEMESIVDLYPSNPESAKRDQEKLPKSAAVDDQTVEQ